MRLGAKAAAADVAMMLELPHVDFVETVLWGPDLADATALRRTADAFSVAHEVVVHVPFTVPAGPEVDVAADDDALREASLAMWAQSARLADLIGAAKIVLHPGAIVQKEVADGPDAGTARATALERIEAALFELSDEHGRERFLMENMPAHYHRSDGTTDRCLAGQSVLDLLAWRDLLGGICLDVSHAFLTPGGAKTLDAFVRRAAADIRHVHLADAAPPDREGLPLGEGAIDWDALLPRLEAIPELTATPEVKGGHADGGAGFRTALEFLAGRVVVPARDL